MRSISQGAAHIDQNKTKSYGTLIFYCRPALIMLYTRLICLFIILLNRAIASEVVQPSTHPVVLVIGTRPEAIKVLPLYIALKKANVPCLLCSTGQHAEMLNEIYATFGVYPDVDFKIMKKGQDLFYISQEVLRCCQTLFQTVQPSMVVVQGDTTSAMVAALAAFYLKIPIGHVEAGLRTGNIHAPFPEELNRRCISLIATLNFAPTEEAFQQLLSEKIPAHTIFLTGNTVVDALFSVQSKLDAGTLTASPSLQMFFAKQKSAQNKTILLTTHRRESIPEGVTSILKAVKTLLLTRPDLAVIFPVHPNPAIRKIVEELDLASLPRLLMTPPMGYHDLVYTLTNSQGVLTDSGGIQEEAMSLQKPLLILRNETDRPEGLRPGVAELVGTSYDSILDGANRILCSMRPTMPVDTSLYPYGDGHASERIAEQIKQFLKEQSE